MATIDLATQTDVSATSDSTSPPSARVGPSPASLPDGAEVAVPQICASEEAVPDAEPIPEGAPPSYAEAYRPVFVPPSMGASDFYGQMIDSVTGLPPGFFVLRNRSCGKAMDVRGSGIADGTQVIAYDLKKPTLKDGEIVHKGNNQLFFVTWDHTLHAASSGLGVTIDPQTRTPRLLAPKPLSPHGPTPSSHPLPFFRFCPVTHTVSVRFREGMWNGEDRIEWVLEVVPEKAEDAPLPKTGALEKLTEWLPFGKPLSPAPTPFASTSAFSSFSSTAIEPPGPSPDTVSSQAQPAEEDPDRDDSPNPMRLVRAVPLPPGWQDKFPTNPSSPDAKAWLKRQWDVATVVVGSVSSLAPRTVARHLDRGHRPLALPDNAMTGRGERTLRSVSGSGTGWGMGRGDEDAMPLTPGVLQEFGGLLSDVTSEVSRVLSRRNG